MIDRLVVVAAVATGGVAGHVRQLVRVGASLAADVVLLAPAVTLDAVGAVPEVTTTVLDVGERPGPRDNETVARLREAVRGATVVHAHGARAGAMTVLAARALGRARPRVVVTLHNAAVGGVGTRAVSLVLDAVVANGADVVLTVSPDLRVRERRLGSLRRGMARMTGSRVRIERAVVPVAARRARAAGTPSAAEQHRARAVARYLLDVPVPVPLVVTVARLAPQKGTDTLLDAAARLLTPGARWLVAGDGPLRTEIEGEIARRGLDGRVVLLGRRADVPQLLRAADVVVSTARWEGQPIAMMEALDAGSAIVATDVGGTSEVLDGAGRLVAPGDATALADAVDRLLADPLARAEAERMARERARHLPTEDDLRTQLRTVYDADDSPRAPAGA